MKNNSNAHVIMSDELGESFVPRLNEEDTKSLSNKTRKTHTVTTDSKAYDGVAILKQMAGVIFKGDTEW